MRTMTLNAILSTPASSLILLTGAPGSGKSTFCYQMVMQSLAAGHPVIFISTEQTIERVVSRMREQGLGRSEIDLLRFVDAYTQTVGLPPAGRADIAQANCADLNTLTIAISKQMRKWQDGNILLVLDSLTSPYLFNGAGVIRFVQLFLAKFVGEGHAVVATLDDNCGSAQDLGAIQSLVEGIIHLDLYDDEQGIRVIKHPSLLPTSIKRRIQVTPAFTETFKFDPEAVHAFFISLTEDKNTLRPKTGDHLHMFWSNLAHWSAMLWDPTGFAAEMYRLKKENNAAGADFTEAFPRKMRLQLKAIHTIQRLGLLPRLIDSPDAMRKMSKLLFANIRRENSAAPEYQYERSSEDGHIIIIRESCECWGLSGVGMPLASHIPTVLAGQTEYWEGGVRPWQAIETKCIALGDPQCEIKLMQSDDLAFAQTMNVNREAVERVHARLMELLLDHLLEGRPLPSRPILGSDVHLKVAFQTFHQAHRSGERSQMAMRMGGTRTGQALGTQLVAAGLLPDEAIECVIAFMNEVKVGQVSMSGSSVRVEENVEALGVKLFAYGSDPSCYFTTGFLNGLFSTTRGQRIREDKCLVAGDPYCEWQII